jgi:hypothetical protein
MEQNQQEGQADGKGSIEPLVTPVLNPIPAWQRWAVIMPFKKTVFFGHEDAANNFAEYAKRNPVVMEDRADTSVAIARAVEKNNAYGQGYNQGYIDALEWAARKICTNCHNYYANPAAPYTSPARHMQKDNCFYHSTNGGNGKVNCMANTIRLHKKDIEDSNNASNKA